MKSARRNSLPFFALLAMVVATTGPLWAQTNEPPARLGIIAEPEVAVVADLLTVEFSTKPQLQVLEREQVARVYREQGLSAANRNYLKLGQVLGADGLLFLDRMAEGTNQFLAVRLVAVKPGVIIGSLRTAWPLTDAPAWSRWVANHFTPLLPKLSVSAQDAVPISVVNLRSPVRSVEAQELERQLTALAIERLTRERELFVLERRRLDLLGGEKELQGMGESTFWNGSYLLDGVIDRDGYSEGRLTIHARLMPPAGGLPMELFVEGPRADLSGLVQKLTGKILQSLRRRGSAMAWEPATEAQKYFEEARWALKWGILPQAKAASESAWALGKRDIDCALARVKSYLPDVPPDPGGIETGKTYSTPQTLSSTLQELKARRSFALVTDERDVGDTVEIEYLLVNKLPDPIHLDRALHLLGLYAAFTRTLPADEPKAGSAWYQAGIETLTAASQVLQYFHLVVDSTKDSRDQLAELRALARSVAERITRPPSVRDSYWVGDREATHDELAHTMAETANVFRCKLDWGCFWQEKPEDCIGVYRELLSSPVFCYFHQSFWFRDVARSRVTAWTSEDRQRVPVVWKNFMEELNGSTNYLWRMEAKALEFAAAKNDAALEAAFEGLFTILFANRDAMITNNVELPYLHWGLGALIYRGGIVTPVREKLQRTEYFRRLDEMDREYWTKMGERRVEKEHAEQFEKQKAYLKTNASYDFPRLSETFRFFQCSKAQAQELAPLLAAYKSNLVAQSEERTGREKARAKGVMSRLESIEAQVKRTLNPASPAPVTAVASPATNRLRVETAKPVVAPEKIRPPPVVATNALQIGRFIRIPVERLKTDQPDETLSGLSVVGRRFFEGKLWLDLRYTDNYAHSFQNGMRWINARCEAAAVWGPAGDHWEIIPYPNPNVPTNRWAIEYFEITPDALYVSGWEYLRRYDLPTRRWKSFAAPWQQPARLFSVSRSLFAASAEAILEIRDRGRSVAILASCRRRPALSALDSQDSLGSPVLFPGPNDSIRAHAAGKIFSWDGHDWSDALGLNIQQVEVFEDGSLLRNTFFRQASRLWLLPHSQTNADLCLQEEAQENSPFRSPVASPARPQPAEPLPRQKTPARLSLTHAPSLTAQSNVYFFVEHYAESNFNGKPVILERDGRHADLVCLDRDGSAPLTIPLRFDLERGPMPSAILDRGQPGMFDRQVQTWLLMTPDALLLGKQAMPGIWVIPKRELDGAMAEQKASRIRASRQQTAATEQLRKALLEKYDRNHDGNIEAVERLAAIGDPVFLEFDLPSIDTNRNGFLDAQELGHFDVNRNSVLDPPELAGIEACLHLLAAKLMKEFDADGEGQLSTSEFFAALPPENVRPTFYRGQEFSRADANRDGRLDLQELESFLKEHAQQGLRPRLVPGQPFDPSVMTRVGSQTSFKEAVEAYWTGRSSTNRSSPVFRGRPSPGPTSP